MTILTLFIDLPLTIYVLYTLYKMKKFIESVEDARFREALQKNGERQIASINSELNDLEEELNNHKP